MIVKSFTKSFAMVLEICIFIKIKYIIVINVIVIDKVLSKYREPFNLVKETLVKSTIKNQQ